MGATLIRVSSRATGQRKIVRVYVYDTKAEMLAAARRFNGFEAHGPNDAGALTQGYAIERVDADGNWQIKHEVTIVRFYRGPRLDLEAVVHEMNHAAVGIYANSIDREVPAFEILDTGNETLAYLQSDLTVATLRRMTDLGLITLN